MNNKNVGNSSIGSNNNENRIIDTSNYQLPISSCLDETEDQTHQSPHPKYQQRQHKQMRNHSYNRMFQPENQHQQHQVITLTDF